MIIMAEYIKYINSKGFTNNTKEAYISDCNLFMNYIDEFDFHISDIDNIFVIKYLNRLKEQGRANSTVVRNLSSINSLLNFMYKKKHLHEQVSVEFEIPLVEKPIPVFLTVEEVDRLLHVQDLTTFKGIRDRCMLELMYACGLKVSELIDITVFDFNIDLKQLYVRKKNDRTRIVPLGSYAADYLKKYLEIRHEKNHDKSEVLFLNLKGSKLSRQGFWKIVKEYGKSASIQKNINTYTLRHSFAIHIIQNGADLSAVQRILGHKNIMATAIYKDFIDDNKIKEIYEKSHPRA